MKDKLFNNLLLFSLFGITLGFFGILYEGVVYGPKLLDVSMERMLFWKSFTVVISPIIYYFPLVHLATITLLVLYFKTPKEKTELKKTLKISSICQILSLVLTIYILTQINFKLRFGNLEKYGDTISANVLLFNILSVFRIVLGAIALILVFKSYVSNQKNQY